MELDTQQKYQSTLDTHRAWSVLEQGPRIGNQEAHHIQQTASRMDQGTGPAQGHTTLHKQDKKVKTMKQATHWCSANPEDMPQLEWYLLNDCEDFWEPESGEIAMVNPGHVLLCTLGDLGIEVYDVKKP